MEKLYKLFLQSSSVCTDTRNILPGSLFFCLKGDNFDGNLFATDALEKGARYVVTERADLRSDERCYVVDNVLDTLQQLALYHRRRLTIPVLGITGTNGKTTTKELVASVLRKKFRTACTQGNLNNHIGVPLTLLSIKNDDEIAIVEMGANHPGEIAQLCGFSEPDFGLITNIGKAHIEGFGSPENIIKTKRAVYDSVMIRGGELFVNADDKLLTSLVREYARVHYYSGNSDCQGKVVEMTPFLKVEICARTFDTCLTGNYNLNNLLAAAAVGKRFGVPDEKIVEALSEYQPTNHRSQIMHLGTNTVIADFYNANPTSMAAALNNMASIKAEQKMAILGDMRELGDISAAEHENVVEMTKKMGIAALFVGTKFSNCREAENSFKTVEELNAYLETHTPENALILIKGSRGIHLENVRLSQKSY